MCLANYEFKSLLILETKVTKAIALIGFYSVPTNPHINNITRGVPTIPPPPCFATLSAAGERKNCILDIPTGKTHVISSEAKSVS